VRGGAGSASEEESIAEPAAEAAIPEPAARGAATGRRKGGSAGAGAAGVEVGPPPELRKNAVTGAAPNATVSLAVAAGDAEAAADTGAVARSTPLAVT